MRLSSEQVRQALLHPDVDVRTAAAFYFSGCCTGDPQVTATVAQAVQQFGVAEAFRYYGFAYELPLDDATLPWVLSEISRLAETEDRKQRAYRDAIISAVTEADARLLLHHREAVLAVGEPAPYYRGLVEHRIDLLSLSEEELWQAFEDSCLRAAARGPGDEEEDRTANVADALAALRASPERVLSELNDAAEAEEDVPELRRALLSRIAGKLRLREAIPLLIDGLGTEDDTLLRECIDALARIGGDDVVAAIAARFAALDDSPQYAAAEVLGYVHTDLAVSTCLQLLPDAGDDEIEIQLLLSALGQFASEAIEPARQFVLKNAEELDVRDVRGDLLEACTLLEIDFPERAAWAEEERIDRESRGDGYDAWDDAGEYDEDWDDDPWAERDEEWDDEDEEWDQDEEWDEDEEEWGDADLPAQPIVNAAPRTGRNEPCPCGSGKKYKNCCLRKMKTGVEDEAV
jgi:hypothetical protein